MLDSRVALVEPIALEALLDRVLFARPRFSLLVLGIFAGIGVILLALGVYGVLASTVSQQTREISTHPRGAVRVVRSPCLPRNVGWRFRGGVMTNRVHTGAPSSRDAHFNHHVGIEVRSQKRRCQRR